MRSVYRKAKKFRLDDDMEVTDEFSGSSVNPIKRGWDFYDKRHHVGMWARFPDIHRWLLSRVGKKWDDVFSEFIRFTKTQSPQAADFLRHRMNGQVHTRAWFEGEDVHAYSAWGWRSSWLSEGDLYVHPETRLLCRAGPKKPVKSRKKEPIVPRVYSKNLVLGFRVSDGYNRRSDYDIATKYTIGDKTFWTAYVFDKEKRAYPVWRKNIIKPVLKVVAHKDQDGVQCAYYVAGAVPVWDIVNEVVTQTASKKDIRKYKLNEKEK